MLQFCQNGNIDIALFVRVRVVVVQCIYNNFIQLCAFDGFSYHTYILSARILRRVSLLTDLRYMELCCFLRQLCLTSQPTRLYR